MHRLYGKVKSVSDADILVEARLIVIGEEGTKHYYGNEPDFEEKFKELEEKYS